MKNIYIQLSSKVEIVTGLSSEIKKATALIYSNKETRGNVIYLGRIKGEIVGTIKKFNQLGQKENIQYV